MSIKTISQKAAGSAWVVSRPRTRRASLSSSMTNSRTMRTGDNSNGEHRLARCFRRFKNEYDGADHRTSKAWLGRWRNWLEGDFSAIQDQRSPPVTNGYANGSASGGNGHDPPKITSVNFEERAIYIFERAIEDSPGARKMNILEKSEVRIKARKIWAGENIAFGLERFELCSADGLRSRIAQMGRRIAVPSKTKPAREQDQQC